MTAFTDWLQLQRDRDDPVGDIARDAALDADWPRPRRLRDALSYFETIGACEAATDALRRAWREWEATIVIKDPCSPATGRQLGLLNRLGVAIPLRCTKGQAHDLIREAARLAEIEEAS